MKIDEEHVLGYITEADIQNQAFQLIGRELTKKELEAASDYLSETLWEVMVRAIRDVVIRKDLETKVF